MRYQSLFLAPMCALGGSGTITHAPPLISTGKLYKCAHTKHSFIKLPLAKIIQYMPAYSHQRTSNLSS